MKKDLIEDSFEAMGTDILLKIVLDEKLEEKQEGELREKIREIFEKSETIFSRFRKNSELLKINKNLGLE
ncbi:MAG: hypothetical protein KAQ63_03245, partial [Candidatus Moranbacteria bacterium]|nr:hypothetical protein [Candidatus Moranbacteria bacterium]